MSLYWGLRQEAWGGRLSASFQPATCGGQRPAPSHRTVGTVPCGHRLHCKPRRAWGTQAYPEKHLPPASGPPTALEPPAPPPPGTRAPGLPEPRTAPPRQLTWKAFCAQVTGGRGDGAVRRQVCLAVAAPAGALPTPPTVLPVTAQPWSGVGDSSRTPSPARLPEARRVPETARAQRGAPRPQHSPGRQERPRGHSRSVCSWARCCERKPSPRLHLANCCMASWPAHAVRPAGAPESRAWGGGGVRGAPQPCSRTGSRGDPAPL